MCYKYQKIELSKIDRADATFRITDGVASAALVESIAYLGVLNPPTLLAKADQYSIVCGFARVDACQELGYGDLISRVITPGTSLKKCMLLAVAAKSYRKNLNTVEQARAIQMLSQVCEGSEELLVAAQHVGLAVNSQMVDKLAAVSKMPKQLKRGLGTGAIALPVALQLQRIKEKDIQNALCQLLVELNFSLNRQRELLEWIIAISKREQVGIIEILDEKPLQQIRHSTELDHRQKTTLIRRYLQKRRWPAISAFESRYSELINELKLKKGARVVAPANLESSTYSIQIDFQDLDEMNAMAQEVQRIVQSPHMLRILDQLKPKV